MIFNINEVLTNILSTLGIRTSVKELNHVQGVTSSIQTQLNNKSASNHNHDSVYSKTGHNHDTSYLKKYEIDSINIDDTGGNWTVDIRNSENNVHGTIPDTWVNVTQRTSGHFYTQIAQQCENSNSVPDASRRPKMWIRDKYASSDRTWSTWRRVLTEDNGIQMKKLWENTNLSSNFDGQSISFSADYDIFIVSYSSAEASANSFEERTVTIRVKTGRFAYLRGDTHFRQVGIDSNKLNFTVAIDGSGSINNKQTVPTAIYGIKGVQ